MRDAILSLNTGSSSIKFGVYDVGEAGEPATAARGAIRTDRTPRLVARSVEGASLVDREVGREDVSDAIDALVNWVEQEFGKRRLIGCGHRIVHGGTVFSDPVLLSPPTVDALEKMAPLAPLHQPRSIAPVHAMAELRPRLRQVGCFDTAFHRTIEPPAGCYALPRAYEERGIRRFLQHDGMMPDELQDLLYQNSGLLGVSGISGDMRDLEQSKDPHAREAVELFVFRAAREIAALASTLGGLDCLVFTAGIGEHSATVRWAICDRLGWLGATIDEMRNLRGDPIISTAASNVEVRIIPTDEEILIARHSFAVIGQL